MTTGKADGYETEAGTPEPANAMRAHARRLLQRCGSSAHVA